MLYSKGYKTYKIIKPTDQKIFKKKMIKLGAVLKRSGLAGIRIYCSQISYKVEL